MQNTFNIRTFLRKEKQKGTNLSKVGKRNSFLRFLKYTQEPKSLDDFFISAQKRGSLLNNLSFIYNNDIDDDQDMEYTIMILMMIRIWKVIIMMLMMK